MTTPEPAAATLARTYDVAMLDLDGVVYSGTDAIPHAAEALTEAAGAGMQLAFVTNNAARTPEDVRDHIRAVGVPAETEQIVTSAQVAARALSQRLPAGATVLVVGDVGLREQIEQAGLVPVDVAGATAAQRPAAVVQGHSPKTGWALLSEATLAVRWGALWCATNLDSTLPSPRGALPGNGSIVGVLRSALQRDPDLVTGKPDPTMHAETVRRTGAQHPLVVGDRLDTDIEGATRVGVDSLLVLTGVATPAELVAAPPQHRPTYVGADLRDLNRPPRRAQAADGGWRLGGWTGRTGDGRVVVSREENADDDPDDPDDPDDLDLLRVVCAAAWSSGATTVRPDDDQATAATARLALP